MRNETIIRFLESAAMKVPAIIKPGHEHRPRREVRAEVALLVFNLPAPLTINELLNATDEAHGMTMLYHHIRSRLTDFGQSFCLFQQPGTEEMYQINGSTNGRGEVTSVDVKIYESMDRMELELSEELHRMRTIPGEFAYQMGDDELYSCFL